MVGISGDNSAQPNRIEILVLSFPQMYCDHCPSCRLGALLDRELALAVGDPAPTLGVANLAALHLNRLGDHECRIEADAELADQAHIFAGVARQLIDKSGGPGPRDRAEIFDEFVSIHADAIIDHRQGPGRFVGNEDHRKIGFALGHFRLGQRGVAQPVASVRGIRNQFAKKDLFLTVERVCDNLE